MPRLLEISAKCSDMFGATFNDGDNTVDYDGYVPSDLCIGGGDYIRLTIDVDTGKIVGFEEKHAALFDKVIRAGKYDRNGEYDEDYPD